MILIHELIGCSIVFYIPDNEVHNDEKSCPASIFISVAFLKRLANSEAVGNQHSGIMPHKLLLAIYSLQDFIISV